MSTRLSYNILLFRAIASLFVLILIGGCSGSGNSTSGSSITSPTPTQSAQPTCSGASPNWLAADASQGEVEACITTAVSGDTINVPAGSATWTSSISFTKTLTIIGAGNGSDPASNTVITGSVGDNCFCLSDGSGASSAGRITQFRFIDCMVGLDALDPSKSFRIDHNFFQSTSERELLIRAGDYGVPPMGLVDHNTFQKTRWLLNGTWQELNELDSSHKYQHQIWAQDPDFGGPQAVYFEDNAIDNVHPGPVDCNYGGRYVVRFNTLIVTDTYTSEAHGVQGLNRACQRWEIYDNTLVQAGGQVYTTANLRGGSGFYFDNISTNLNGFNAGPALGVERITELKDPFGFCDGTWIIDGNTPDKSGWPCRDQIGRVHDDFLYTGDYDGMSGSGAWPTQASYPAYCWHNLQGSTQLDCFSADGAVTQNMENQDWYNQKFTFDGTEGMGRGALASRPSTCTAGVAYWATDQGEWNSLNAGPDGQLYQCTATNTWTLLYKPYTYPHPLQGS